MGTLPRAHPSAAPALPISAPRLFWRHVLIPRCRLGGDGQLSHQDSPSLQIQIHVGLEENLHVSAAARAGSVPRADAPPVPSCSVLGSPRQQANLSQQTINFCFPVFPLYFRPDAGAVLLPKLPRCCRSPPSSCRCCAAEAAGMLCAASVSRNVCCKWGRGKFAPLNCCS